MKAWLFYEARGVARSKKVNMDGIFKCRLDVLSRGGESIYTWKSHPISPVRNQQFFASRKAKQQDTRPAVAAVFINWRSEWNAFRVIVPLPTKYALEKQNGVCRTLSVLYKSLTTTVDAYPCVWGPVRYERAWGRWSPWRGTRPADGASLIIGRCLCLNTFKSRWAHPSYTWFIIKQNDHWIYSNTS